MKILLLSAYDADSHAYWRQGLLDNLTHYDWTVLTLPARYFSWRVRGNALSWAFGETAKTLRQPYDLIIATSMTDLATLKGFVPELANIPTLLYFHENQFAYPTSEQAYASVEPKILNLYSALAADQIVFNTDFNRQTFLNGVSALLKKLPDHIPSGIPQTLEEKSHVLAVPLPRHCFQAHQAVAGPLHIVWNHRWEYDKGPDQLLAAIEALSQSGASVKFHIVGQQFRQQPSAFATIHEKYPHMLGEWGYIPSAQAYRKLLRQADVVLSTAHHDFQGIAVLEGVAAGAIPVVPDRLAYQELFDQRFRYPSGEQETTLLVSQLTQLAALKQENALPAAPDINSLSWQHMTSKYQALIEAVYLKHKK